MNRLKYPLIALCMAGLVATTTRAQEENGHKRTIVTHSGQVVKFERTDPAMVVLKAENKEITAQLAPMTFIEKHNLMLSPGDEITVKGYTTTENGKTEFVVTEIKTKSGEMVKLRGEDFKPVWTTTTNGHAAGKLMVIRGAVQNFERRDPAMVVLKTEKDLVHVQLAPVSFLEEHKLLLDPGQEVTIKGYETTSGGKQIFVATEVTVKDGTTVKLRSESRDPVWVKGGKENGQKIGEMRDITGAVTVVQTTDTPDGRLVTVKANGEERVIALGPGTYLEKHRYTLTPGDRITVRGWEVNRDGNRVFLASEVNRGGAVWKFRRPDGTVLWVEDK